MSLKILKKTIDEKTQFLIKKNDLKKRTKLKKRLI